MSSFNKFFPYFAAGVYSLYFIVYRLEIQSVMLVFSTQPCELLPLFLLSGSTVPPPPFPINFVNKYTVYTFTVYMYKVGDMGFRASRQINICRKVPLQVNIFRWRHFALSSMSLIFPLPSLHTLLGLGCMTRTAELEFLKSPWGLGTKEK
jgi:hypothetical protein